MPGLGGLHPVAHAGREQHDGRVGERDDVDLGLADPDRLDEHDVAAGHVEDTQRLRGGGREPAELPAGGHRPDEHARVLGVLGHPHPVTEQRASGEGRGRVDRQHPDPVPAAHAGP